MPTGFVRRNVTAIAEETLADTPVVVISGARQVGKSTLMHQLVAGRDARVLSLDSAVDREAAARDPDGFAAQYPHGTLAIDEIQRVPALLTSVKASVDQDRRPGRFVVTGSTDLLTLTGAQESLAGRAQTIALEGFSRGELANRVEDFATFAWSLPNGHTIADSPDYSRRDYVEIATTSTFPELREASERSRARWLDNYVERVLSKDSTDITGIAHPDRLRPLLDIIAANNGGEFVTARMAREVDIPERSLPTYLRALQSSFLIRVIPGWSNNLARRAVRTPKVCVSDTGLAARLTGVDVDGLELDVSSALTGGLTEGFVVGELMKQRAWSQKPYSLSHFRDNHGHEVDIVMEDRRRMLAGIEVKASSTVGARAFRGLEFLREKTGERFVAGIVLYTGTRAVPFGDRLWALPLSTLWAH